MRQLSPFLLLVLLALGTPIKAMAQVEFVISMERRWNMISAPVIPENATIEIIFRDVVERDNLIICKDEHGRFYIPEWDYNNIPNWDFHRGYQVKLVEADTLIITGEAVDPETPIQLRRGWNLIAYFLDRVLNCNEAFANIENHLLIAKNWRGDFYVPDIWEDFLLRPGEGYQVKVDENAELVWPQE